MENTNCKNIDSCDYCNSCDYCDYCNSCDYCDYCDSCNSCDYCNSCYSCYSCDSCKNLKMTEYNIFCYSEKYNDENSFQQKRYRAFNKEVGETRYNEIKGLIAVILKDFKPNLKDNSWSDEWKKVSQEQWKQLLAIPEAKDFKEGFEYISGVKIEVSEQTNPKEIKINGATYLLKE